MAKYLGVRNDFNVRAGGSVGAGEYKELPFNNMLEGCIVNTVHKPMCGFWI